MQYYDVITNSRWRTAANTKTVTSAYLSEKDDSIITRFCRLNQIMSIITRSQAVARIADRTASQQTLCTAHEPPCSQLDKFPVTLSQH